MVFIDCPQNTGLPTGPRGKVPWHDRDRGADARDRRPPREDKLGRLDSGHNTYRPHARSNRSRSRSTSPYEDRRRAREVEHTRDSYREKRRRLD